MKKAFFGHLILFPILFHKITFQSEDVHTKKRMRLGSENLYAYSQDLEAVGCVDTSIFDAIFDSKPDDKVNSEDGIPEASAWGTFENLAYFFLPTNESNEPQSFPLSFQSDKVDSERSNNSSLTSSINSELGKLMCELGAPGLKNNELDLNELFSSVENIPLAISNETDNDDLLIGVLNKDYIQRYNLTEESDCNDD